MNPRFPIYIPSKGRAKIFRTMRVLQGMGIYDYKVIVEKQEYHDYAQELKPKQLLILDPTYQRKYDTCDKLGASLSRGPGPARNFAWDHSISMGAKYHWVMDDNILDFERLNRNIRIPVADGTIFRVMEDFVLRYSNVAMAGPNYRMFAPPKLACAFPPFVTNTRIYSCNFIRNDIPFRWRGRYNEDTILSLDILTAGWCTVQFNAFLQNKVGTQIFPGGNTKEFYKLGTRAKSEMLVQTYPKYARIVTNRFNRGDHYLHERVHHYVDYSSFKQGLKFRPGKEQLASAPPNEYGMRLVVEYDDGRKVVSR